MNIDIKEYKGEYEKLTETMVEEEELRKNLISVLKNLEKCGIVAMEENELVGAAVFSGANKTTELQLYVKPLRRNSGIGTMILKAIEEKMSECGVEKVILNYTEDEFIRNFVYKRGYEYLYRAEPMIYKGGKINLNSYDIREYEDKYFDKAERILSTAFHKMRLSIGMKSKLAQPSEEYRNHCKDNKDNMFVLFNEGEIVAVTDLDGNCISHLAVDIKHQGKGYGRILASYAVNKILERGYKEVILWCLVGNTARFLYESI